MNTRKIIIEVICLILMLHFFYEGVYKIAYWQNYAYWMKHAPLLKPVWQIFTYAIPVGEILLALSFLKPSFRVNALYISIAVLMVFVFWIMCGNLFTHRLFWPYHALYEKSTWMQKMLISIGLCWLAFAAVVLLKRHSIKGIASNSLRNEPVSAH